MTKRTRNWPAGYAAAMFGIATVGYAAPPPEPDSGGTDLGQILDNAQERVQEGDPDGRSGSGESGSEDRSRTFTDEPGQDRPLGIDEGDRAERQDRQAPVLRDAEDRALQAERLDQEASRRLADESAAGRMPAGFEHLGLTDREQAAVLRTIAQYDRQAERLLEQFSRAHAEAIGLEAIALAEKMRQDGGSALVAGEEGASSKQRSAGFRPGDAEHADKPAEQIKDLGKNSPFAGPTGETWKKLHETHLQIVTVEAQKLAAVEKLLSPEQLERLHGFRAEAHSAHGRADRPDRPDLRNADQNEEEERRDREADRAEGARGADAGSTPDDADPNRSNEPLPQRRESGED